MNWQALCEDVALQNLPYKMELNQQGQIIMSPASVMHVIFQGRIIALLNRYQDGCLVVPEFPVETRDGVKVVDIGILTHQQIMRAQNHVAADFAPVLCVEVLSPGNTLAEMENKKILYFEKGAEEFWLCDQTGSVGFYNQTGQLESSDLIPPFPSQINIE